MGRRRRKATGLHDVSDPLGELDQRALLFSAGCHGVLQRHRAEADALPGPGLTQLRQRDRGDDGEYRVAGGHTASSVQHEQLAAGRHLDRPDGDAAREDFVGPGAARGLRAGVRAEPQPDVVALRADRERRGEQAVDRVAELRDVGAFADVRDPRVLEGLAGGVQPEDRQADERIVEQQRRAEQRELVAAAQGASEPEDAVGSDAAEQPRGVDLGAQGEVAAPRRCRRSRPRSRRGTGTAPTGASAGRSA